MLSIITRPTNSIKQMITPYIKKLPSQSNFANLAGETLLNMELREGETLSQFTAFEKKHLLDPHFTVITDLGFIYENKKEIELYAIGCFTTEQGRNSHGVMLSTEKNLLGKQGTQYCVFFRKKVEIRGPFQCKSDSYVFLLGKDKGPSRKLETSPFFRQYQAEVLQEHAAKGIKSRIAKTDEERELTGLMQVVYSQKFLENESIYNKENKRNDPTMKFPIENDETNVL